MSLQTDLYYKLYLARQAEVAIRTYYHENDMKTPMHMSYGQEIAPVGVCQALRKDDQVFGTYRSHALYLAKSGNLTKFFGEMYGKVNGIVCGKAGSMHLSDSENGYMGASAVVASSIPVAVGAAHALKYKNTDFISVPFFGDGAIDEGNFWESINIATSKRLPILFVLEHNGLAVNTPPHKRQGYDSIINIMKQYRFSFVEEIDAVKTPDVEMVYDYAKQAIDSIKSCEEPAFLRINVERGIEHVGIKIDYDGIKRIKPKYEDSVTYYRKKLLTIESDDTINAIESKINEDILNAINSAKSAEFPSPNELYNGVFV